MSEELEWELWDVFESGLFPFPVYDHQSARRIVRYLIFRGVLEEEIAAAIEDSTADLHSWLTRSGHHMVGEWIIAWLNDSYVVFRQERHATRGQRLRETVAHRHEHDWNTSSSDSVWDEIGDDVHELSHNDALKEVRNTQPDNDTINNVNKHIAVENNHDSFLLTETQKQCVSTTSLNTIPLAIKTCPNATVKNNIASTNKLAEDRDSVAYNDELHWADDSDSSAFPENKFYFVRDPLIGVHPCLPENHNVNVNSDGSSLSYRHDAICYSDRHSSSSLSSLDYQSNNRFNHSLPLIKHKMRQRSNKIEPPDKHKSTIESILPVSKHGNIKHSSSLTVDVESPKVPHRHFIISPSNILYDNTTLPKTRRFESIKKIFNIWKKEAGLS